MGYTTNYYDNLKRVVESRNANGRLKSTIYDALDRPIATTDTSGVTITNYFDLASRLVAVTGAGWTNSFGYSSTFQSATSQTNAIGKVMQFAFDAAQRKTNEIQVGLWTNKYTYNGAGDLVYLYDGQNNRTDWKYDFYGRVIEKWYQGQATADLVYSYDTLGRLASRFNRTATGSGTTGYTNTYTYDLNSNLTLVDHPTSPDLKFTYNALNQVTGDCVAGGITNNYTYSPRGQLLTETTVNWAGATVTLGYTSGLRTSLSLTQPNIANWTQTYQYDAGKRLTNLPASSGTFPYAYTSAAGVSGAASRLVASIGLPVTTATASIVNLYDSLGRMTNTVLNGSGGGLLNRHGYIYNPANRITRQTRTDGGYVDYTYDDGAELQTGSTSTSGGTSVPAENFGYAYDPAQNLLRRTNNAATTVYPVNALNQVTNGLATYSYDRRGNRIGTSNNDVYNYDDESQLVTYYNTSIGRTDFIYDARMRLRIRKEYVLSSSVWVQTAETRYIYDGMRVLQERDSSNVPQVTYTRGLDLSGNWEGAGGIGGLLARTAHSSTYGSSYSHAFYHGDRGGNITYLLNSGNTMGATYRYDPFGRPITSSGSLATANVYRFSSKEWCATSGLYYYGYRFYDPLTQRWLNRDPIGERGGINLYTFVENSPIIRFDRVGYSPWSFFAGCVDDYKKYRCAKTANEAFKRCLAEQEDCESVYGDDWGEKIDCWARNHARLPGCTAQLNEAIATCAGALPGIGKIPKPPIVLPKEPPSLVTPGK